MTKLVFAPVVLRAAAFGGVNPMPDMKNTSYIHAKFETTDRVTEADKAYFGKGKIETLLPYLTQDDYNREPEEKTFQGAILENAYLKAVFLPELGGRLWSLYHKKLRKELLYVNSSVQPANLALRNAWVAGGVEWNVGIKGHSPLTCERLFTAESRNKAGEPVLTMYEYERIRGTVFGINAMLEEDRLYIRTTVENCRDTPTYTYWWSNIAVRERGVRVVTEAEEMFTCVYEDNRYTIDKLPATMFKGVDLSWPERAPHAGDIFYVTKEADRRWIAALDPDGSGLLQYSTPELIGRKVFFWGQGTGGRNWNRWLTGSEEGYIEIQAGLLRTQMEHIPMEPHSRIGWTECYTAVSLAEEELHSDWAQIGNVLKERVRSLPDPAEADIPVLNDRRTVFYGSGWGALEEGEISKLYPFPAAAMTAEQESWLCLREKGYLPEPDAKVPPVSYRIGKTVLSCLESSLDTPLGNHWYTWLHIGINRYALGDFSGARKAWEASCGRKPTPWALRNLAMLCVNEEQDAVGGVKAILEAVRLCETPCRGLLQDAARILTEGGKSRQWITLYRQLPEALIQNGRLRLYTAVAYMNCGETERAKEILNEDFTMSDIKEGELSVSALWQRLYGSEKILPEHLNFRMYDKLGGK